MVPRRSLPSKVMEVNFDPTLLTGSWDHFKCTFDIFLNVLLTLSKKLSLKTRRKQYWAFLQNHGISAFVFVAPEMVSGLGKQFFNSMVLIRPMG